MGCGGCLNEASPLGKESWILDDLIILEVRMTLELRNGWFRLACRKEDVGIIRIKSVARVLRVVGTHLAVTTKAVL